MADTAQVLIQIRGDVGDINAKLTDLKGNIGRINRDLDDLGKLGKLSWAAFAAGIAGAVYAAQQAINTLKNLAAIPLELADAFGKQEEAEKRLQAVLAAHGVTNRAVTAAYIDMAAEIQRTTKYSDDMVISAQAVLTSMGVLPSRMRPAIEATAILATRTGSLESAAQALGQALNGNYRALRQIVPAFKGAEEGALSANEIFRMIRETLGEQAQAEAEGYIGKLQKLRNAWDDLKETLGQYVIPKITELIELVTRGIHAIEGLLGVTTTAWKKKELDILEKAIADAEKRLEGYEGLTESQRAMLAIGGDTGFVYKGMNLEQAKARARELRAELEAAGEEFDRTLKEADKSFKAPKSHLYDDLMRQWALTKEKLQGEIDTAGLDDYEKALARIEVQAARLRDQFRSVKEAGPLIDAWENAKKAEAELENLLRVGEREKELEERIRQNRERQLDLLDDMRRLALLREEDALKSQRAELAVTESEYLRGQIRITEELIRIEKKRQDKIDTTDENNLAMWLRHEAAIDRYKAKLADLVRAEREASASMTEALARGLKEYADEAGNTFGKTVSMVKRAFTQMEDALIEFVKTGKVSFKDLVDSIINDLLRLAVRKFITGPLAGALGLGLPGFHRGGMADEPTFYRLVPVQVALAAPRYHTGIGPDERLAVIHKTEGIFTQGQMRALGALIRGGDTTINVPVTVEGGNRRLASELQRNIERAVEDTLRRRG